MYKKIFRFYLLALTITVAPSGFAFAQDGKTKTVAAAAPKSRQTEPSCKEAKNVILRNNDPTILEMAMNHSEKCKEIAIMIAKGAQDEANLTGEVIGKILVEEIEKHGVPAKFFVAPGGDFTLIAFYVNGQSITKAPVGLDISRSAANLAVAAWQSKYADSSKRDH